MFKVKMKVFAMAVLAVAAMVAVAWAQGAIELPKTGQTTSYATGDDGDIQAGVAWPSPRFTDNGNGTITDNLTGLIWLKNVGGCFFGTWADVLHVANTLKSGVCGLSDGSQEGDWRLPNVNELESLRNAGEEDIAIWLNGQGFTNVVSGIYWSSSTDASLTSNAWRVSLENGDVLSEPKTSFFYFWSVRGATTPPAQLWKTGQTTSYATGDDGGVQAGVAWPSPRFTGNGDGTITDNLTGLIWLKDAGCFGLYTWESALFPALTLESGLCGLSDGSQQGDWRLPNMKELRSLIDYSKYNPALPAGHPFTGVQSAYYWSSSTYAPNTGRAWMVSLLNGQVYSSPKTAGNYVWAVRSGEAGVLEAGYDGATRDYGKSVTTEEPISAANGAYLFDMKLLSLGGPMNLSFELFYRSDMSRDLQSLPSAFWWRPFARASSGFEFDSVPHATVYLPDGSQVSFKKDGSGNWVLTGPTVDIGGFTYVDNIPQFKFTLKETTEYLYLMDPVAEQVYIFWKYQSIGGTSSWRIARIMDRNGNQLAYTYPESSDFKPTRVEDGLGRSLDMTYSDLGIIGGTRYLVTITDQAGRQITLNYETKGADNADETTLRSVTDPLNNTTTFQYAGRVLLNNLIASQTMPLGNTPYTQTYALKTLYGNSFPRVTSQADALGNTTNIDYNSTTNVVTVQNPDGTSRQFEHYSSHGFPKSVTDETGKAMQFAKSAEEHITGTTDRLGDSTSFTFHAETGKLASTTNAKSDTLTHTYTAQDQTFTNPDNGEQVTFTFFNLTRTDYPGGTNDQFTCDAQGNVSSRVDRNGRTWSYTYNGRGQVLTATNPTGGVTTFTYNNDATMATRMDSDTGVTTFGYDLFKRLAQITHPDATFSQFAYDANDRITSLTDEQGNTTAYTYDANGNLVSITDPAGQVTQFAYDAMDRRVQRTDRLANVRTFTYDSLGRLASTTDPTNIATTFGYDPRNWLNQVTRGGHTWARGYDDEGIVASRTTPLGHTTTHQTDKLGYLTGLTNPLNQTTTFTRDAMSRLTGITDPLNRTSTFAYDGRGLLTGVTTPVIGTATYQRDGLGLLSQLTDLNGQIWAFTRTAMGRLASTTDPLGDTWGQTYDTRGRLTQSTYPDGGTLTRTYDAASNLTRRLYSDGPDLQYTYDALNRLMTANDLTLTRDAEGGVTNTENPGTSFGATYDDAGRLKTASYNNGAFTVTYTYDATTGLLTQVTDDLIGTQVDFAYDNDFRLTTITRSNGVTTTLTWDNAARLTRIQDGTFLDLQYTLDAAGQVTQLNMTAPLDPASLLIAGTESFSYDNASQLTTPGYSFDERGRLTALPGDTFTWDGASRLTGISGAPLSYNGLGDLVTRASGETIHYYYNYAIGLKPIMAEKNDTSGQFLRYYVWTPGGSLLYMIDAADGNKVYFYHFDRTGSTLALTDQSGAVTDAYAYDPYGRLLAHQGSNPQPFTFVGKWGVRQDPSTSSGLYHMRARYYDAQTSRFISRDPVWPEITDPRQLNPYQYVANEPVRVVDVTGLGWKVPLLPLREELYEYGVVSVDALMYVARMLEGAESAADPVVARWGTARGYVPVQNAFGKFTLYLHGLLRREDLSPQEWEYFDRIINRMLEIQEEEWRARGPLLKQKPAPPGPPGITGQRETAQKLLPTAPTRQSAAWLAFLTGAFFSDPEQTMTFLGLDVPSSTSVPSGQVTLVALPDGRVVLFGGEGENGLNNDLFLFENSSWSAVAPANTP